MKKVVFLPFKKELSAKNKPINKARRQNIFNVQNPSFIAFEKAFLKKQHKPINKKKHIRLKLNLYTRRKSFFFMKKKKNYLQIHPNNLILPHLPRDSEYI